MNLPMSTLYGHACSGTREERLQMAIHDAELWRSLHSRRIRFMVITGVPFVSIWQRKYNYFF